MLCEKVVGTLEHLRQSDQMVEYVDFEWHETYKRIHRKSTRSGQEIGIRLGNEILTRGLKQDDILYVKEDLLIAVNILPAKAIVINIDAQHPRMHGKVCYEIGNRHAAFYYGTNRDSYVTPYSEPTLAMLQKMHGVRTEVTMVKLDSLENISSSVNEHTH